MPVGLYSVGPANGSIANGDTVVLCAPRAAALLGKARGYLGSGQCSTGTDPLLKLVVAVAGDVVDVGTRAIAVNGRCLGASETFDRDGKGRPLPHVARGSYRLKRGELWLWGPATHSFDSRYFGAVEAADVTNIAKPFAVWPAPAVPAFGSGPCPLTSL
jgi:conjugative transfer signal peptidase TraF